MIHAPWTAKKVRDSTTIYDANLDPVCKLDLDHWDVNEDSEEELEAQQAARAALIAAAPDYHGAADILIKAFSNACDEAIAGAFGDNMLDGLKKLRATHAKAGAKGLPA